jgi:type I restriction enzyme S subunit
VLATIDDKIDSNRRLRLASDEAAAELFRASQRHRRNQPTTTGGLIEQGLLSIGDGFRAKNSELAPDGIPFARARNLTDGFDFTGADRVPEPLSPAAAAKRSSPGDVVFTSKGTVGRFAFVDRWIEPFVYSPQLCYWRSLDSQRLPPVILLQWMQGTEAKRQFDALKGQTDMADYVSLRDQRSMVISLPQHDEIRHVAAVLEPLAAMSGILRAESRTLATLRDTLLPKLVSDEIRVPDTNDAADVIMPSLRRLRRRNDAANRV